MTYTLIACFAFNGFFGACGRYIEVDYQTLAECRATLDDLKIQPAFSYGLCKPRKEQK
jgi:hypothetical protein